MRKAVLLVVGFTLVLAYSAVGFSAQGDVAKGKAVYEKERCKMCHAIEGVGNKKNPLDGVGSKLTEEQMEKWIKTPKEMDPKTTMKAYPNISDQDLDDLVAYLMTLKKQ